MGQGEVYTVEFYQLLKLAKPVKFSAEPDTHASLLSFALGVHSFLKRSETQR